MWNKQRKKSDFGVTLVPKILTYAEYAAALRTSQALKSQFLVVYYGNENDLIIENNNKKQMANGQ